MPAMGPCYPCMCGLIGLPVISGRSDDTLNVLLLQLPGHQALPLHPHLQQQHSWLGEAQQKTTVVNTSTDFDNIPTCQMFMRS